MTIAGQRDHACTIYENRGPRKHVTADCLVSRWSSLSRPRPSSRPGSKNGLSKQSLTECAPITDAEALPRNRVLGNARRCPALSSSRAIAMSRWVPCSARPELGRRTRGAARSWFDPAHHERALRAAWTLQSPSLTRSMFRLPEKRFRHGAGVASVSVSAVSRRTWSA